MKMNKIMSALVLSLSVSSVMAAPTTFSGNITVTKTAGDAYPCTLLGESVKVGVSQNVTGGFECTEISGVMNVATCHAGGNRGELVCGSYTDSNNAVQWNHTDCATGHNAGDTLAGVLSFAAYTGTSLGGAIAMEGLNGRCSSTSLGSLNFWQTAQ